MSPTSHRLTLSLLGLVAAAALVVACGGGADSGGGAPAASQPAAPTTPAPAPPAAAAAPAGSATISGSVAYEGAIPELPTISMDADPACAAKHTEPVKAQTLVLGADQKALGNVLVYVKSGLSGGPFAAPSEPAVIDQQGCVYIPHVLGAVAGQPIKFLNSDGVLHNVHALPAVNREFNLGMPPTRTEATETFSQPEDVFKIKCDVHPWMNAFVKIFDHPYFDTTVDDGQFSIANLPAGTYEVEAWHEKLGTQTQSVTVADGATATVQFTFAKP